MDLSEKIKSEISDNPIVLYMKGTKEMPMCGFSARTVEALKSCGKEFAYVNVILDSEIMQELPNFADWPTFPQLYVKGEFIGGIDIMRQMHDNGEFSQLMLQVSADVEEYRSPF